MKTHTAHRLLRSVSLLALTAALFAPVSALARERTKTVQGSRGGTFQRQVTQTPGNLSASSSATLPNGKTASGNLTSQRTDTGRTTSAQATGFNGKTATYESTSTRTENGFTRQAEATGPKGGEAQKQVTVTRENGVVTRSATTTTSPRP
ncbi:MAG: hypothetical protein JNL92_13780 [Opitutaceae bacterium]|nr:hypothetical protein [Opitutaceae bacterium]